MSVKIPNVQQYLNYRGDVTAEQWLGRRVGPNTLGERLFVIDWTYDDESDLTTVGLAYIDPTPERRLPPFES